MGKSKFGLGLILGIVGGALAGLFLSPKSGQENREAIAKKIEELKKTYKEIDRDKYIKIVNEAIEVVKEERQIPTDSLQKLKDYFIADWNKAVKDQSKKK